MYQFVTLCYTVTTAAISIVTGAAYQDKVEMVMEDIIKAYKADVVDNRRVEMPKGSEIFKNVLEEPKSAFLENARRVKQEREDEDWSTVKEEEQIPDDAEYRQAMEQIITGVGERLATYPAMRTKVLTFLGRECGGSMDMVNEIIGGGVETPVPEDDLDVESRSWMDGSSSRADERGRGRLGGYRWFMS